MALKIGVIGAGGIARGAHFPILAKRSQSGEIKFVGISDVDGDAAKSAASEFGAARSMTDPKELLPLVDAVMICIPTPFHAGVAIDALREGKSVFCEKPLARTMEQADAMIEAQDKAALQVGFVRHFDPEWLAIREAIQAGRIGRPIIWRHATAGPGPDAPWYNADEIGGGPFLDGAIHNMDFALSIFGPAKRVFCNGRAMRSSSTAIDTGTVSIAFASGDELLLSWSWGLPRGTSGDPLFDFLGAGGTMTWPADNTPDADGNKKFLVNLESGREEITFPANALDIAFNAQIDEFIAVAQGKSQPRVDGLKGRETLRLALAVLQAGRSGQIVEL